MHYIAQTSKVHKNKLIQAKQGTKVCYETKYGQPQL